MSNSRIGLIVAQTIARNYGLEIVDIPASDIPEGSMRVAPNTDAVVWRICPDYKAEL